MQITINNQEIDYTLEGEKDLLAVIESLREWLREEGYVLVSARTEHQDLDHLTDGELAGIPLSEVQSLHIDAQSLFEKEYRDLAAVDEFFRLLEAGIEAGNHEVIEKLLAEYRSLREGLDGVLERNGLTSSELTSAALDAVITESGVLEGAIPEANRRESLFAYIDALRAALRSRMSEMEDPESALKRAAADLKESVDRLSDVSIMLQTGRDQDAMQAIVGFTELSSKIVRLYPLLRQKGGLDFNSIVVEGVSFSDFYIDFNKTLGELIDAFGSEDSVLIGDLLEYEIAPRLTRLRSYIDLITRN